MLENDTHQSSAETPGKVPETLLAGPENKHAVLRVFVGTVLVSLIPAICGGIFLGGDQRGWINFSSVIFVVFILPVALLVSLVMLYFILRRGGIPRPLLLSLSTLATFAIFYILFSRIGVSTMWAPWRIPVLFVLPLGTGLFALLHFLFITKLSRSFYSKQYIATLAEAGIITALILVAILFTGVIASIQTRESKQQLAQMEDQARAAIDFTIYKPTYIKNGYSQEPSSLDLFSLTKDELAYEFRYSTKSNETPGQRVSSYEVLSFKMPKYFKPPTNCGIERPLGDPRGITQSCTQIGATSRGEPIYIAYNRHSIRTIGYVPIGDTLITFSTLEPVNSRTENSDVIRVLSSLKSVPLSEP